MAQQQLLVFYGHRSGRSGRAQQRRRSGRAQQDSHSSGCARLNSAAAAAQQSTNSNRGSNAAATRRSTRQVPALYVMGESIVDVGNNNLFNTLARVNFTPYGVDFTKGEATGRFSNGRNIADFIASFLGLPSPPPYFRDRNNIVYLKGANFASGSTGVLPQTHLGDTPILSDQVSAFETVRQGLVSRIGQRHALRHISGSIFFVVTTHNDNNNYYHSNSTLSVEQVVQDIVTAYKQQVQRLYSLGARKFVLASPSSNGCIPFNVANGSCSVRAQNITLVLFNELHQAWQGLRTSLPKIHIVEPNFYRLMLDVNLNPANYGFSDSSSACCVLSSNRLVCLPGGSYCPDRTKFAYWDAFHPTDTFAGIAANKWWSGIPSEVYPYNIRKLAYI